MSGRRSLCRYRDYHSSRIVCAPVARAAKTAWHPTLPSYMIHAWPFDLLEELPPCTINVTITAVQNVILISRYDTNARIYRCLLTQSWRYTRYTCMQTCSSTTPAYATNPSDNAMKRAMEWRPPVGDLNGRELRCRPTENSQGICCVPTGNMTCMISCFLLSLDTITERCTGPTKQGDLLLEKARDYLLEELPALRYHRAKRDFDIEV